MTKPVKLTLGIGAAGAVCLAAAASSGGAVRWLLFWAALSCFVAAAAYAWNRPDVFGKVDGRLSAWRSLVAGPYLAAFWLACTGMRAWRRLPPVTEVAPGIWVGGRIRKADLPPDIELVVDLVAEFPEPWGVRSHPGYRCLPVLDGAHPADEEAFRALLREVESAQGAVLFHCDSGIGRAPTAAIAALLERGIVSEPGVALELIRKSRPRAHPTRTDLAFIDRVWRG